MLATRAPAPFLGEAVASVASERPADVVVVDDGTGHVDAASLPAGARVLRVPPSGRSTARNAGAESVSTPFVAFLDDDDTVLPGHLARLRAALEAAPAAPLAFGHVRVVGGDGRPREDWNELLGRRFRSLATSERRFADVLASRCPIYTSATIVRREAFLAVGGYDPALDSYEDLDLYLRLSRIGQLAACEGDPVTLYRLHGGNTRSDRLYEGALAVTAKHLGRARGRDRRLLFEWRADALWGLRRLAALRREGGAAIVRDPLLLMRPRFAKRLLGSVLPIPTPEAQR